MESILASEMSVSVHQIMVLLGLMTVALLFGYMRLALFFAYVFVFYWGNILNVRQMFSSAETSTSAFSFMFTGFGLIVIFLALVGFLLNRE